MARAPLERLTRREREIMNVLFALDNRASAEDVRARLTNSPSYSAVRTMLTRLEQKGYLRHSQEGVRYVYSATTSQAAARRAALGQYLRTFFGGSRSRMLTALLRQEDWTEHELEELESEIERIRGERKQS
ncbi:MAG: CopY family transcriptional regulator [Acidobacteria bacterium]|nr:MAG: CopY family transcriptional regulator [Acidobacteriota bacterium]